jgi:SM-20-related protein
VQVEQYLQPPAAERLHRCLRDEVPWTLALRDGAGARTIDHAAYAAMDEATYARLVA